MTTDAAARERLRALVRQARVAAAAGDEPAVLDDLGRAHDLVTREGATRFDGEQHELLTVAENLGARGSVDDARRVYAAVRDSVSVRTEDGPRWVVESLYREGLMLSIYDRFDDAEKLLGQSAAQGERYFGAISEPVVRAVFDMAKLRERRENLGGVIELLDWLRPELKKHYGEAHQRYLDVLSLLGYAYDQSGDWSTAEALYRDWLRLSDYLYGIEHAETARALYHVAELARIREDFDDAEPAMRRALELTRTYGERDAFLALIENNYAETLGALGRHDDARPHFEAALALRTDIFGPESAEVARSLFGIAHYAIVAGRYKEGLEQLQKVRALYETVRDDRGRSQTDALIAVAKTKISGVLPRENDADELERNVAAMSEAHGPRYPELLVPLLSVARVRGVNGQWQAVRNALGQAREIADDRLVDVLRSATMRAAATFGGRLSMLTELWLTLLAHGDDVTGDDRLSAYDCVQRRKGIETRMLRMAQSGGDLIEGHDPDLHDVPPEEERERHAMMLRVLFEGGTEGDEELRRLRRDQDDWEHRRSRATPRGRIEKEVTFAGFYGASIGLRDGVAVVEYAAFDDRYAPPSARPLRRRRYAAFVLRNEDDAPHVTILGDAQEIDDAVRELRAAVTIGSDPSSATRPEWLRVARFLYRRLVEPLLPQLDGVRELRIAPEDQLALLPFELLASSDDRYLIDDYRISYLLLGSELFRLAQAFTLDGPPIVIADPDFDAAAPVDAEGSASGHFPRLSGSRDEGEFVAGQLGVQAAMDADAGELLLMTATRPEIVHVATHGFVLGEAESLRDGYLGRRAKIADPLDRCGLAFAGANRTVASGVAPAEDRDGLLFASELLYTDFRRTDLVVLAACRSAEGDVVRGDTVYGLRRAFKAGGAHSIVCCLWNVPDDITRRIVTSFYTRLLAGAPRVDALHEARMEIRAEHPRQPVLWAGIILDGDNGPLRRLHPASRVKIMELAPDTFGRAQRREQESREIPEQIGERLLREARAAESEEEAIARLDEALSLDVSRDLLARCHYAKAAVRRRNGRLDEALAGYDELLAEDDLPMEVRLGVRNDRAVVLVSLGRFDESIEEITALMASPNIDAREKVMLLVNRSYANVSAGRAEEGIDDATTVIEMRTAPRDQIRMALRNRAEGRLAMGDPDGAAEDITRALTYEGLDDAFRHSIC